MSASQPCSQCGSLTRPMVLDGLCPVCLQRQCLYPSGWPSKVGNSGGVNRGPISAGEAARQRVADYEIVSEIARGGMGIVYRARQLSLNRPVALKLLLAGQFADIDQVKRFRTEAEAVARLDHPGIVQIYEVGEFEGRHFFSMCLIEGRSLSAEMNDFGLGAARCRAESAGTSVAAALRKRQRELAGFLTEIARAVQYAHDRGVLHRDLKPANVLVDAQGHPHVTDFGLARVIGDDRKMTATGAVFGTPSYMPPEQTTDPHKVTVAADVYSVGAIGYELLAGQPPFEAGTAVETVIQLRQREPTAPRDLEPNIQRDLETIILKCLSKDPTKRYHSALALAEDLERFVAGETIQARPASTVERAWRWSRRHPAIASLSFALVALVLSVAVIAPLVAFELSLARKKAEDASDRARSELRDAKVSLARAERLSRQASQRDVGLRAVAEAARIKQDRVLLNEAVALLVQFDTSELHFKSRVARGMPVAMSPDFSTYYLAHTNGGLEAVMTEHHRTLWRWPEQAAALTNITELYPSPDGTHLVIYRHGTIDILNLSGPALVAQLDAIAFYNFGSDGEWFLMLDEDRQVQRVHTATGQPIQKMPFLGASPGDVAASQIDERPWIAVLATGRIEFFDWKENRWVGSLPANPGAGLGDVAWGGDWIGCVENSTDVRVWHLPSRRSLVLNGHQAPLDRLLFIPGTSLLLTTASDGQSYCWDAASGAQLLTSSKYSPLQVSSDGRQLLFGNPNTWGRSELATSSSRVRIECLDSGEQNVREIQFAEDSRWVLVTKQAGVHLVDRLCGAPVGFQPAMGAVMAKFVPGTNQIVIVRRQEVCWHAFDPESGRFTAEPLRLYRPVGGPWLDEGAWTADGTGLMLPMTGGVVECLRLTDGYVVSRTVRSDLEAATQMDVWGDNLAFRRFSPAGVGRINLREEASAMTLSDEEAFPRFSPDGRWLLLSGRSNHRVFRTRDWHRVYEGTISGRIKGTVAPGAWTPDSLFLARALDRLQIEIYEAHTWKPIISLTTPQPSAFSVLGFSPGCRWLAAGTDQGSIELWDLVSLQREVGRLRLKFDWPVSPEEEGMPLTASRHCDATRLVKLPPRETRRTFPPRPADTGSAQLDLTQFYNSPLYSDSDVGVHREDLPDLPPGLLSSHGVEFDARGIIQLSGDRMKLLRSDAPELVTDIPIARRFRSLHVLASAQSAPRSVPRPMEIAQLRLQYADGTHTVLPVRLGEEVEDWWSRPRSPLTPRLSKIAWRGISSSSEAASAWQQMCHFTLDNPRPDVEVTKLDLISTMKTPSLYVFAISLE